MDDRPDRHGTAAMQTFLDDAPLDDAGQTLAEAITAAGLAAGGRMIVEATADGRCIPPAHLEYPPTHAPYARELRFITASGAEVVAEAAQAACAALDRIEAAIAQAARDACLGRTTESMESLSLVLGEWGSVQEAATLILQAQADAADFDHAAQALVAALTDVQTLLSRGDWSALSDTLEDELTQVAHLWRTLLEGIATGA